MNAASRNMGNNLVQAIVCLKPVVASAHPPRGGNHFLSHETHLKGGEKALQLEGLAKAGVAVHRLLIFKAIDASSHLQHLGLLRSGSEQLFT